MRIHIEIPFEWGKYVLNKVTKEELYVYAYIVREDLSYSYGVINKKGEKNWVEEYEIEVIDENKRIGFKLDISNTKDGKTITSK